ncbi:MAG TPA: dihydroneopterin aldolase [Armatimonadota bacterium]|nr:dihydroneopterin aldolase [Armatimonadota bacterium]
MSRGRIRLSSISLYGSHAVTPAEREVGRPFEVDVELALDLSTASETDDLGATVDYAAVCEIVRRVHEAGPYHLLEAMAGRMAKEILGAFAVDEVTVRVRKPHPPVGSVVGAAEVEITRRAADDSSNSEKGLG